MNTGATISAAATRTISCDCISSMALLSPPSVFRGGNAFAFTRAALVPAPVAATLSFSTFISSFTRSIMCAPNVTCGLKGFAGADRFSYDVARRRWCLG